jgi:hypothetical protein
MARGVDFNESRPLRVAVALEGAGVDLAARPDGDAVWLEVAGAPDGLPGEVDDGAGACGAQPHDRPAVHGDDAAVGGAAQASVAPGVEALRNRLGHGPGGRDHEQALVGGTEDVEEPGGVEGEAARSVR